MLECERALLANRLEIMERLGASVSARWELGQCCSQALLMTTREAQAGVDAKYPHDQSIE